jgi:predicted nucleotidyltransferase
MQKDPNSKHPGNPGHNEKTKRIIGVDENEDFQLKGPANIFNKIIEENFPNPKKEMPMIIQEAYRTPSRLDQKRNSSRHIIIRTTNALNKERILKAVREKGQVTSITIDGETKEFHDKTKFTQYFSKNPAIQRIITGKKKKRKQYKDRNHAPGKARK